MELYSDYREKHINELFGKKNINYTKINLEIGDFKICYNETIKTIIERKTINDLVSSIIDGRYKEQSLRLSTLENIKPYNIFYIIEGNLNTYKPVTRINIESIKSAMFTLSYYKGFNVINTNNKEETADKIKFIFDKISKNPKADPYSNSTCNTEYVDNIKQKKNTNIDKNNIEIIMLSQIPGISTNIAKSILNSICFKDLVNGTFEIIDIYYINNEKRKIPKKTLINIKHFLSNI